MWKLLWIVHQFRKRCSEWIFFSLKSSFLFLIFFTLLWLFLQFQCILRITFSTVFKTFNITFIFKWKLQGILFSWANTLILFKWWPFILLVFILFLLFWRHLVEFLLIRSLIKGLSHMLGSFHIIKIGLSWWTKNKINE